MQINDSPVRISNRLRGTTPVKQPAFHGLLYCDPKTRMPLDSWFFRDYETLKTAVDEIKSTFPDGAEVLDFACSNGEETISIKSLLDDSNYKVIGYDSSTSALKLAKKGLYTVFSHWYDSYLMPNADANENEMFLRNKFNGIMEEIFPKNEDRFVNNKAIYFDLKKFYTTFEEKFFRINKSRLGEIDIRKGNIMNIDQYRNRDRVGAIFFRNALYQMTGNDINETIGQKKYFMSKCVDKKEIIERFVSKIHSKLEQGGVFVLGDHIKDHIFLADDDLPDDEIVLFRDTPFFDCSDKKHVQASNLKLFKNSPLKTALEKDNKFIPIGFSKTFLVCDGAKVKVPTVWKKIR